MKQKYSLRMRTGGNQEFEIPKEVITYAYEKNKWLNDYNATFFNPSFLKKADQLHTWIATKPGHDVFPEPFQLVGQTRVIPGTFFNRKSDTLLIIGPGFNNKHEQMASCIKLFPHYDLVFFDFPGHGLQQSYPQDTRSQILRLFVDLDMSKITFGPSEVETVLDVTNYFKKKKPYKTVVGLGFCYSVTFLVQAAAQWGATHEEPLFDKLILDSSWAFYQTLVENLPLLHISKLRSPLLNAFCASLPVKKLFLWGVEALFDQKFDTLLPLTHYLSQLTDTQLFFIHSYKDIAISTQEFETIWKSIENIPHKCALFTHNKHVRNHFSQKELFKFFGELFIELTPEQFRTVINDVDRVKCLYDSW